MLWMDLLSVFLGFSFLWQLVIVLRNLDRSASIPFLRPLPQEDATVVERPLLSVVLIFLDDGKRAVSYVSPVDLTAAASLLEVRLETGRTHQIRVQLAAEGHPIAGDERYGDADFNRRLKSMGLKRMFLHAHALSFEDPVTGEVRAFSTPLPEDLRRLTERLSGS